MERDTLLNLFKNCNFNNLNKDNFDNKIIKNLNCLLQDFTWNYGETKCCIILKEADYVIKIPFRGSISCGEEYDFENANFDKEHFWDYCFSELIYYNLAKRQKIEKAFAKTRLLGIVQNYPIYIQEKVTTFSSTGFDPYLKNERTEKTRKYCKEKNFYCFNNRWLADAFQYYGEKRFNKIINFLKDYDIEDLHIDNIGYIGSRPVILDFSDFLD